MTEEYQQQAEAPLEEVRIDPDSDESAADEQNEIIEPQDPETDEFPADDSPAEEEVEAVVIEPQDSSDEGCMQGQDDVDEQTETDSDARDAEMEMMDEEESNIGEPPEDEQIEAEIIEPEDEAPQETEASEVEESPGNKQTETESPPAEPEPEVEVTVESVVEAVLFASDEPLTPARLAGIVESNVKQVREHIKNLNTKYAEANNAFRIEQIAGGYQMMTLSPFNHWLQKLLRVRSDGKLSPAALETLAIVAYKQPVIRADIEVIRGVATGEVLRGLMYKGLVKIVGRAEVLGRPMLYGTTKKFLTIFGLNSLKDLPKVEELKKPPS